MRHSTCRSTAPTWAATTPGQAPPRPRRRARSSMTATTGRPAAPVLSLRPGFEMPALGTQRLQLLLPIDLFSAGSNTGFAIIPTLRMLFHPAPALRPYLDFGAGLMHFESHMSVTFFGDIGAS